MHRLNVITDNVMYRLAEIKLAKTQTILNKKVGMTFVDHVISVISVKLQQSYRNNKAVIETNQIRVSLYK